jgi:hypothetical protein
MRLATVFFVASVGANYAPPAAQYAPQYKSAPVQYAPPSAPVQYAPASAPAQYAPPPAPAQYAPPAYAAPVDTYAEDSHKYHDQYWDNQQLCTAEFDLTTCLMSCESRKAFFEHERIKECTVKFVKGLCGSLAQTKTGGCDNGDIKLDAENCPKAAFADALLVFNKLTTDLNSALTVSTQVDKWSFITTKLALQAARNNADCVINSFLNYLNQCKTAQLVDAKDSKCVDDYLNHAHCQFAEEDIDGWNLPQLVERYGLDGAEILIKNVQEAYGYREDHDIAGAIHELLVSTAGEDTQGIQFASSQFEYHLKKSSLNVCPENFLSFNENFEATGLRGLPELDVAFHFPAAGTVPYQETEVVTNDDGTVSTQNVGEPEQLDLDPFTDKTIYDECANYFHSTQLMFEAGMTGMGNRCISIDGYGIHFVESGATKELNYELLDGQFTAGTPPQQCYKASWDEAKTCSTHLSEWHMTVSCCKSYETIHNEHSKKNQQP